MADPATVTLAVKAAVAAATDKRTWKVVGVIIGAILTPFIIIIMAIASIGSGTASHNNASVDYVWNGGVLSENVPLDYQNHLNNMRSCFSQIDNEVAGISSMIEDGGLDSDRIKSIFYAVYFGSDDLAAVDIAAFVDCFVDTEERTRTVTDVDGNETEEAYIVKIPVDIATAYSRVSSLTGFVLNADMERNINRIYTRGMYGEDTLPPIVPNGLSDIVDVAASQIGNVGGRPYWSWYGFGSRVEWCACFVSWCAEQCGYIDAGIIPKFAGCQVGGVAWFKENNLWQDGGYFPSPGDIIFFDWKGTGRAAHVGIVEAVVDGYVYTIEGNTSDSCARRKYAVDSSKIMGYGTPQYPPKAETSDRNP